MMGSIKFKFYYRVDFYGLNDLAQNEISLSIFKILVVYSLFTHIFTLNED